jgi:hypothetical protein
MRKASGPSSSHLVRSAMRRWPVTQARVRVVSPKEIPKVVGLRFDDGERAHSGRLTARRTPLEAIIGAGQDAGMTTDLIRTSNRSSGP